MNLWPHLHLDLDGCTKNLDNTEGIDLLMNALPELVGMRTLFPAKTFYYGEDNIDGIPDYGCTSVVGISTSHSSIHTFANQQYCTFDLYSCKSFDEELIISKIIEFFDPKRTKIVKIGRGPKLDIMDNIVSFEYRVR